MTTLQKVIKYCAIALAIFLSVSIIGAILGAVGIFTGLSNGKEAVLEDMQTYSVSQDITNLKIEISAADFVIKNGETFAVESNLKKLTVKNNNGTLNISEKTKTLWKQNYNGATLILYIPQGFTFDNANIVTGAGKLTVDTLSANKLHLELGAGQVEILNLNVNRESEIEGGAGEVTVKNSKLNNLDLDMGVGKLNLTAAIYGKSQLDLGVGESNINLLGSKDDYRFEFDKGIGNITIDGQSISDGEVLGNGASEIEIDCGIGAVNVNFDGN